jgi:anaerobic selenocysteine-containing dehydrogenase
VRTTHVGACPLDCPDTCSWVLEAEGGRVVSIRGNKAQPFTHGALCGKVNRYLDHLNGDRVLHPLVRTGAKGEGRFARASWDEALDRVADGLQRTIDRHGAEAILPYFFAGSLGMIQAFGLPQRILYAMGTSRLDTTICTAAWRAAAKATIGGQVCIDPESLPAARLIVIWGANPLSTGMHVWKYVNEARAAGAHVVCIDPLRSPTAERCDEHVAPRPGTDAALALGLMRVIRDAGGVDEQWLEAHAVGWPELRARLDEWPVERAAAICGLPEETVRDLGRRLAATRPSAIMIGLGLQRHGGGGSAVRAIMAIPALTGDWRHVGGGVSGMTGGHFPSFSAYAGAKAAGITYPRSRVVNMSRLGEALHELDDPPVSSLLVFNCNPAATSPDARRVRAGMLRDDLFTVVLEQRMTDTADLADVVLPATMQPEHADLHDSYGHLYLSWNEPAVPPPGECLPNAEILRRIAARLGFDQPALQISDLDFGREMLAQVGIELADIRAEGFLRVGPPRDTAPFAAGGFPTPSGRVELVSQALIDAGRDGLPSYELPHEAVDDELAERFPLVLLAPAGRFFLNSTFAQLDWHRSKTGAPTLWLHPADAAARGLVDGDTIRCHNDRGAWTAALAVSDATRPGVCFTLKTQWPKLSPGGENVNACTPERDTDIGGGPTFHDNRVEVSAAAVS